MKTQQIKGTSPDFKASSKQAYPKDVSAKEFFETRFERDPKNDIAYYKEWEGRFASGHPEDYMDSKSKAVFKRLQQK